MNSSTSRTVRHPAPQSWPARARHPGRHAEGARRRSRSWTTTCPDDVEVDAKLVALAGRRSRTILTNDFNLNRVAELQGVRVLNINSLANAVKPAVLPGEQLHVRVIQEGKEAGQGVGFLDDGTMIVVEGGVDNRPGPGRRRHPRAADRRRADDLRPAAPRLTPRAGSSPRTRLRVGASVVVIVAAGHSDG